MALVEYCCFNTPKGHLHLQTIASYGLGGVLLFQYPEGSPTPADNLWVGSRRTEVKFQYPEGSPTPADVEKSSNCKTTNCFNTPKGHLHLQTRKSNRVLSIRLCFNTPKGHLHLQTFYVSENYQWTTVSIPRRVTYTCRLDQPIHLTQVSRFNTPKGHLHLQTASTPVPATAPIPEFQYPEGSPTPADVLVRTPV